MLASELIDKLQDHISKYGDSKVVSNDGYGFGVEDVFWDEDENSDTVVVIL